VSLKWLHEYDVQGRLPQDYILWRVDSAFWFQRLISKNA
jgi:hypothetical protein